MISAAIKKWAASWRIDRDGDIALVLCNRLALIKHRDAVVVRWADGKNWPKAPARIRLNRG